MTNFRKYFLLTILIVLSLCSWSRKGKIPEMTGYRVWTVTGVAFDCSDFSALTKTFDGEKFIGAFNSGGLYYFDFPKEEDSTIACTPLWAYGEQFSEGRRDMEGLAIDRRNGDLYFSQERSTKVNGETIYEGNTIYCLRYPEYRAVETIHTFGEEFFPQNNYTIEGFTWVGKGRYLLGREGNPKKAEYPAAIMEYTPEKGITRVTDVSDKTKQIAGMEYDPYHRWIWILDGDYDNLIHVVKASKGHKQVADFDISFIDNAEGICIDRENGCIWIASDETPSKLYRLDFKGL